MTPSGNSSAEMSASDFSESIISQKDLSNADQLISEKSQRSMKRRRSAIAVFAKIPNLIKKRLSMA